VQIRGAPVDVPVIVTVDDGVQAAITSTLQSFKRPSSHAYPAIDTPIALLA
jgi:hypothetical protein